MAGGRDCDRGGAFEHIRVVPDELLRKAAISFVDDLYKEVAATTVWGSALQASTSVLAPGSSRGCLSSEDVHRRLWGEYRAKARER